MKKLDFLPPLILVLGIAITLTYSAELKKYSDNQHQFSFEYPEGWSVFSREEAIEATGGRFRPSENLVVMVANPKDWDQNVNVQVLPGPSEGNISEKQWMELMAQCDTRLSTLPNFKKISATIREISGFKGIEYVYEFTRFGLPVQQKQVSFLKGRRFYIITCTAKKDDFANSAQVCFNSLICSFKAW